MLRSDTPLEKEKWTAENMPDQSGKIVIITGANSGLGYEASLELARKGAKVIMACRSRERGEEARKSILEEVPDADLEVMELDLSSFESIKQFATDFSENYERLDIIINNAGIMQPPRRETEEGFELQIGVNHLGHFLLTGLLMEPLKSTPGSRIVNQSSFAHTRGSINFDDINAEESYSRTGAYAQSKLANLLFTFEFYRKAKEQALDVKSVGVHPGYTATSLQHNGPTVGGKSLWSRIYSLTNRLIAQDVSMGVLPTLYAATEADVEGGDYIGPGGFMSMRGHPKRVEAAKQAYDEEDAAKLWDLSEELTGISYL